MPLIDELLPTYDVSERHSIAIHAPPAVTYSALETVDLARSRIARSLLWARALPAAILRGRGGLSRLRRDATRPLTLSELESHGFRRLASAPPHEIVLGLEGRFWRPGGGICTPPAAAFGGPPAAHTARAVWNFTILPDGDGGVTLQTETRVLCADASVRRRFLPYWTLIRPASGFLRRSMLVAVRRDAESPAADTRRPGAII
jgi:hypothetical protein